MKVWLKRPRDLKLVVQLGELAYCFLPTESQGQDANTFSYHSQRHALGRYGDLHTMYFTIT